MANGKRPFGELDEVDITVMCEDSVLFGLPYLGQHGVSLLIRATREGLRRTILMDTGQHAFALLENFKMMRIDPAEIDTIVLTHCHYDHTGGLAELLKAVGKRNLPVVAHPALFRPNFSTAPYLESVGVPEEAGALREAGAELYLTRDPLQLMPGLSTTGEIARKTDFEGSSVRLFTLEEGRVHADAMLDDSSLVACVRGRSPIVMTGCSHAGIVNIVTQVGELCGTREFESLLGGLHLIEAPDERIERTTKALKTFSFGAIRAGHCTGFRAQMALSAAFGAAFAPLQTGMRVSVRAAG